MKREVVQDFLNLPGIAGVALMDGRSRPYFYGVDKALNFQQKEALAQGIQQVVETTPAGFEFFEFQFTGHQVYIYKLDHGIILLVLTNAELVYADYLQAIEQLRLELRQDAANAIATFRLLAGNISLTNQNYWKRRTDTSSVGTSTLPETPATTAKSAVTSNNGTPVAARAAATPTPPVAPPVAPPVEPTVATTPLSLKELVGTLNHVSQFTTHYLGTTVVANYWKTTRPGIEWLNQFQIDRSAHFTLTETSTNIAQAISSEQSQWVREWISAFVERCSKVIRDFSNILDQSALDDRQKALLPTPKS